MSYLISVNRLKSRLENNQDNTVLVDVRFQLGDPQAGRKAYLEEHIPGAVYMDLEKDLSGKRRNTEVAIRFLILICWPQRLVILESIMIQRL